MPISDYTLEELAALKIEFNGLATIEEKYKFFNQKFKQLYSDAGRLFPLDQVQDFLIRPKTEEETEELNLLLLDEAKWARHAFSRMKDRKDVFDIEKEKKLLNEKLRGAINPLPILKKELQWIEEEVKRNETQVSVTDPNFYKPHQENSLRAFWLHGFAQFYYFGNEPDLRSAAQGAYELLAWNNGFEIAQYKIYLERRNREVENKQTHLSREETSIKRQLLLLYYTGYIKQLNDRVKTDKERNKLLALLLNRNEQNVKKVLTYINHSANLHNIKTEENLQFVLELLDKAGLTEEAERVKIEIDTVIKKKK